MVRRYGKQRQIPGAFDRLGNFPLMCGTVSGNTARHYFAPLSYKVSKGAGILVIDGQVLLRTESANLPALKRAFSTSTAGATRRSLL